MAYLKPRDWKAYVRYAINHAGITTVQFITLVRDKDKDNEIIEPKEVPMMTTILTIILILE